MEHPKKHSKMEREFVMDGQGSNPQHRQEFDSFRHMHRETQGLFAAKARATFRLGMIG